MTKSHPILALAILLICYSAMLGTAGAKPTSVGGNFRLTSHLDEPFELSDIEGKVGILFFGFTHCPDVCPNTLLEIQRLLVNLKAQSETISVLFISVDPKRDTIDKLKSYVEYFNSNITGLTGSAEEIDAVLKQYNSSVAFEGDTDSDHYNVEHTANIFLINKQGELSSIILPRTPYPILEQQVRKLIEQ